MGEIFIGIILIILTAILIALILYKGLDTQALFLGGNNWSFRFLLFS